MTPRQQLFHDADGVEKKIADFCEQHDFPPKGAMLALVRVAARCGWLAEISPETWARMCAQVYEGTRKREEA